MIIVQWKKVSLPCTRRSYQNVMSIGTSLITVNNLWTLWHLPAPRMNFDEIGVTINLLAKFWWRCLDGKPEREIRTTSRTPQHRNWCITRSCSKMLGSCSLLGFMHLIKWGAVLSSLCINLFNWPCTSPEIKTTVVNIQLSLQNEFSKCEGFWDEKIDHKLKWFFCKDGICLCIYIFQLLILHWWVDLVIMKVLKILLIQQWSTSIHTC